MATIRNACVRTPSSARSLVAGDPFAALRSDVGWILDAFRGADTTSQLRRSPAGVFAPRLNVWEQNETLYAEVELPGVKQEDIELSVQGRQFTLKAERKMSGAADDASIHRREVAFGEAQRSLQLPYDIDADGVRAELKNGVLTVTLPKAASAKARKITVNAQ
ncbi:MAG: Hsp20/alpha crystallin family protein [Deltaproteobacteria bacterium]|nr:Hsp20/alpha crystallin family protein [Deltaproteobacteria bacterium]